MRPEKIAEKVSILEASSETLKQQIAGGTFYSYLQVKIWRKRRANINAQLRYYKAKLKELGVAVVVILLVLSACSPKLPMPPKPPKLERNHYKR